MQLVRLGNLPQSVRDAIALEEDEVSEDMFFEAVGKLNCHPTPLGRYPYTSSFRTPSGDEIGRIVNEIPDGQALPVSRYFVAARKAGAA